MINIISDKEDKEARYPVSFHDGYSFGTIWKKESEMTEADFSSLESELYQTFLSYPREVQDRFAKAIERA